MCAYKFTGDGWQEVEPEEADIIAANSSDKTKTNWIVRGCEEVFTSLQQAKDWWVWYNIPPEEFHSPDGCWVVMEKKSLCILCRHATRDAADRCAYRRRKLDRYRNILRRLKVVKVGYALSDCNTTQTVS